MGAVAASGSCVWRSRQDDLGPPRGRRVSRQVSEVVRGDGEAVLPAEVVRGRASRPVLLGELTGGRGAAHASAEGAPGAPKDLHVPRVPGLWDALLKRSFAPWSILNPVPAAETDGGGRAGSPSTGHGAGVCGADVICGRECPGRHPRTRTARTSPSSLAAQPENRAGETPRASWALLGPLLRHCSSPSRIPRPISSILPVFVLSKTGRGQLEATETSGGT